MPLPKNAQNDKARIDERRAKVAALYLAGKSQQAIAGVVGVSQMTVSKDLAHLRAQWRANAMRDFGAKQAEELAKLAHSEREAWEAWRRSCGEAETEREKLVFGAKESPPGKVGVEDAVLPVRGDSPPTHDPKEARNETGRARVRLLFLAGVPHTGGTARSRGE
jgi:hypothetical protein